MGGGPIDVAVGDFDQNGRLDVATANGDGTYSVRLGDGTYAQVLRIPKGEKVPEIKDA